MDSIDMSTSLKRHIFQCRFSKCCIERQRKLVSVKCGWLSFRSESEIAGHLPSQEVGWEDARLYNLSHTHFKDSLFCEKLLFSLHEHNHAWAGSWSASLKGGRGDKRQPRDERATGERTTACLRGQDRTSKTTLRYGQNKLAGTSQKRSTVNCS